MKDKCEDCNIFLFICRTENKIVGSDFELNADNKEFYLIFCRSMQVVYKSSKYKFCVSCLSERELYGN